MKKLIMLVATWSSGAMIDSISSLESQFAILKMSYLILKFQKLLTIIWAFWIGDIEYDFLFLIRYSIQTNYELKKCLPPIFQCFSISMQWWMCKVYQDELFAKGFSKFWKYFWFLPLFVLIFLWKWFFGIEIHLSAIIQSLFTWTFAKQNVKRSESNKIIFIFFLNFLFQKFHKRMKENKKKQWH